MKPHIMIVDDASDHIQLMRRAFSRVNPSLQIVEANSGNAALEALRSAEHPPKVILLDLRMPGKSGHEILKELKSDKLLRKIPVCVFSSSELQKDICECYDGGVSIYFKKPMGFQNLVEFAQNFNTIWFKIASHCCEN